MARYTARIVVGAFESLEESWHERSFQTSDVFENRCRRSTALWECFSGFRSCDIFFRRSLAGGMAGYDRWISAWLDRSVSSGRDAAGDVSQSRREPYRWRDGRDPCWVRNIDGNNFQVFAINCAHLGCPVRWFPQSRLFMCPCHGGVYYEDGARASGPPERGLFEYSI